MYDISRIIPRGPVGRVVRRAEIHRKQRILLGAFEPIQRRSLLPLSGLTVGCGPRNLPLFLLPLELGTNRDLKFSGMSMNKIRKVR